MDPEKMSDEEFRAAVESGELPGRLFHHREHVRLAWIYARTLGAAGAARQLTETIRAFAVRNGATEKYHQTVTVAWANLVAAAAAQTPQLSAFGEFAAAHPLLLDKNLIEQFYSHELLDSEAARTGWVEPDLKPLPAQDVPDAHSRRN
jgi:hypothetical protein